MIAEFGTDHVYNCDVFNEVPPTQSDPDFVSSVGASVYSAMTTTDPDAIWLFYFFYYTLSPFAFSFHIYYFRFEECLFSIMIMQLAFRPFLQVNARVAVQERSCILDTGIV